MSENKRKLQNKTLKMLLLPTVSKIISFPNIIEQLRTDISMFINKTCQILLTFHYQLKIYTTLGYIVTQILLNLGHVFRFREIVNRMFSDNFMIPQ